MSETTTAPSAPETFFRAAAEEVESGGDEHVEETIDIEGEESEAEPGEETPAEESSEGDEAGDEEKPEVTAEGLIEQFAKEMGLNLEDPNQRKIAKRLADKELYIQQLKAGSAEKTAEEPAEKDYLAEFEQSLDGGDKPAESKVESKPEPKPDPGETVDLDAPEFVRKAKEWGRDQRKAYAELNDAYAQGDWDKASNADDALFFRRMLMIGAPLVERLVEARANKLLKEELGDVIPAARQSALERQEEQAREYAIQSLSKIADFKDIVPKMFAVEPGDDIEYSGRRYDNNPINRIFREHPGLLDIRKEHKDPDKARALTFFTRYLEAAKIYKSRQKQAITPAETKRLVDAGAKMEQREQAQRTRQKLNSGTGATGLGKGSEKKSWAEEILEAAGQETSARSLFK